MLLCKEKKSTNIRIYIDGFCYQTLLPVIQTKMLDHGSERKTKSENSDNAKVRNIFNLHGMFLMECLEIKQW